MHPREMHRSQHRGWLRAAVLGSNDAIVSTASLLVGVAATEVPSRQLIMVGVAGLVAGSMSMAAGEYVAVSSQRDSELADIKKEGRELAAHPEYELHELRDLYVARGLDPELALKVAQQLSEHDSLKAHLRDELGIDPEALARPFQAAWISAVSFAVFALVPIAFLALAPNEHRILILMLATLASLAGLGALGARLGGAPIGRASLRVTLGGLLAMTIAWAIGRLIG